MQRVLLLTIDDDAEEMLSLLRTLRIEDVKIILQKRTRPHKTGYLGPGKLNDVDDELKQENYDAVIVNGDLKPSQHHYLEMRFQKTCIDRTGVILKIFAEHAHTPEAIAQVTLAKLRYEQPFLRERIHKTKKGDRPGFLAGGEYATDTYYQHMTSHVKKLEERLEDISRQRQILRSKRHARGYSLISLAGYTNAGKSALFNALSDSKSEVDQRLFSTLATTTKKVAGLRGNILIADTVGFIKNLPLDLVDAFKSTLEEIYYADMILLVFDASESTDSMLAKLRVSLDALMPRIADRALVVVGNKIDLVERGRLDDISRAVRGIIGSHRLLFVSAKSGAGLDELRSVMSEVQDRSCTIVAEAPMSDGWYSMASRLRETCEVSETVSSGRLRLLIKCSSLDCAKIVGRVRKTGATVLSISNGHDADYPAASHGSSIGSEGAPLK